jgi:hypothetical protein
MKKLTATLLVLLITGCIAPLSSCSSNSSQDSSSDDSSASSVSVAEGEFVTDPDEPDMGEYTVSSLGTKLYYSPDEFSPEIIAALEKYFISFSQSDYESYSECVYPDYVTEMNKYLEADYGYDIEQSFANQCANLEENAGGEFTITRIKAELPDEDGTENYLTSLDDVFETDFYDQVKNDCDALHDMIFYVMVEVDGEETLLISEFEIVFAEKDGKFYTFG